MKSVLTVILVGVLWAVAAAQVKTGREQAGLRGAVQTVKTEAAELKSKDGRRVAGQRVPLQTAVYDARGNRVKLIDYNHDGSVAQTLIYTFDAQGRNTGYEEYTGTLSTPRRHIYVSDDKGQRIEYRIVQPDGSAGEMHRYKYDAKGNLIEETLHDHKGIALLSRNVYAYDDEGRQVSQTRYNADGSVSSTISRSYGAEGRLAEQLRHESDILTYRVRYVYDRKGRVVAQETVGSVVEADLPFAEAHAPGRVIYVYKGQEQPRETIAYAPDGLVRERVVIEYDSRGNWIKKTHTIPSAEGRLHQTRRVEYRTIKYF